MKTIRRVVLVVIAAVSILCLLVLPLVHWRIFGWVHGEAFWLGRPTSYWSQTAGRLTILGRAGAEGSQDMLQRPPLPPVADVLMIDSRGRLGMRDPNAITRARHWLCERTGFRFLEPPNGDLGPPDAGAAPVLVQLLRDPNPTARAFAAQTLGYVGAWYPETRGPAIAALKLALGDTGQSTNRFSFPRGVGESAQRALWLIEAASTGGPLDSRAQTRIPTR